MRELIRPIAVGTKTCSRCRAEKPRDVEHFHRCAEAKDGLNAWCKPCQNQYSRDYHRQDPKRGYDRTRNSSYRRRYGITVDEYDEMLERQGGVCAVCGSPPTRHKLAVDHDHATGKVRALLCSRCNCALGQAGDNADRLDALAAYVRSHKEALV